MIVVARMLLRRLLLFIPLVLGVILFVFIVMRFAPTDPALAAFDGGSATAGQLEQFREENGLNDPLPLRYVHFVGDLAQGDFGTSLITRQPVIDTIRTALPLTVQLTALGIVIALSVATLLGVSAAVFRDRWPDQLIRLISWSGSPPRRSGWPCC